MATLHALLQPYKPTPADPFDTVKAAHLLNRAGFGGTPAEVARIVKLGPADAVDMLFDFPDAGADEQSEKNVPDLSAIEGYPKDFRGIQRMYAGKTDEERKELRQKLMQANREAILATAHWWLSEMAYGPRPLQEKLTLFWHGHFTTSAKDERAANLMWRQNELLRQYAAGNFHDFVKKISRDPAMLDYLNNNQNRKEHPNENYARELMELFTLGIGNYTEQDVKEGARAFTGWGHDGEQFVYRKNEHDTNEKTFLGRRGNFDGDDVIEVIFQQAACPRYIATKLFKFFAYEDVDDALATSLGITFHDGGFELRPLLRTIFSSKAFYSPQAIGGQIKSPIQLAIGLVKLMSLELPQVRLVGGPLAQMGQVPFNPPNVKGWPGGRMWINTSTLFVRYNTGVSLASGLVPFIKGVAGFNDITERALGKSRTTDNVVDYWVARMIQRPIDPTQRQVLLDALGNRPDREDGIRKVVQLIVSMPEFQLC